MASGDQEPQNTLWGLLIQAVISGKAHELELVAANAGILFKSTSGSLTSLPFGLMNTEHKGHSPSRLFIIIKSHFIGQGLLQSLISMHAASEVDDAILLISNIDGAYDSSIDYVPSFMKSNVYPYDTSAFQDIGLPCAPSSPAWMCNWWSSDYGFYIGLSIFAGRGIDLQDDDIILLADGDVVLVAGRWDSFACEIKALSSDCFVLSYDPLGSDWPEKQSAEVFYSQTVARVLFGFTGLRHRVVQHLFSKRRVHARLSESRITQDNQLTAEETRAFWPICEAFVGSEIRAYGFSCTQFLVDSPFASRFKGFSMYPEMIFKDESLKTLHEEPYLVVHPLNDPTFESVFADRLSARRSSTKGIGEINILSSGDDMLADAWQRIGLRDVTSSIGVGPFGTQSTLFELHENEQVSEHLISQSFTADPSRLYTVTVFAKASGRSQIILFCSNHRKWIGGGGGSVVFDLLVGSATPTSLSSPISHKIVKHGDGWYECCVTVASLTAIKTGVCFCLADCGKACFLGNATPGVILWGPSLSYGNCYSS